LADIIEEDRDSLKVGKSNKVGLKKSSLFGLSAEKEKVREPNGSLKNK